MTTNTFFTADTHFWHKGILRHAPNRPYTTVEEMNAAMIADWNGVVGKHDAVYHLGDFSFGGFERTLEVVRQLNGVIFIVPGNHDALPMLARVSAQCRLLVLPPLVYLRVDGESIHACHFPLQSWRAMQHGSWMLHGHCHGNLRTTPYCSGKKLDVGIDAEGAGKPLHLDQLRELMRDRHFVQVDHHKEHA